MNADKTPPQETRINTGYMKDLETISEVYLITLPQDVITTTEDKLRLCLSDYLKKMEKKKSWLTPMGLTISFTLTLMTSSFKDLGLSAATWRALFIIGVIAAFSWLIYSIIEASRSVKIEDIIIELKKHSGLMIKSVKK